MKLLLKLYKAKFLHFGPSTSSTSSTSSSSFLLKLFNKGSGKFLKFNMDGFMEKHKTKQRSASKKLTTLKDYVAVDADIGSI